MRAPRIVTSSMRPADLRLLLLLFVVSALCALLLVDWLNALIFEMATRSMLFSSWEVECEGQTLHARVTGEPVDRERHRPVVEVKGATFTSLDVRRDSDGLWRAECVVDV